MSRGLFVDYIIKALLASLVGTIGLDSLQKKEEVHRTSTSSSRAEKSPKSFIRLPSLRMLPKLPNSFRGVFNTKKKYSSTSPTRDEDTFQHETPTYQESSQRGHFDRQEHKYSLEIGNKSFGVFLSQLGLVQTMTMKDILKIYEFHLQNTVVVTLENVVALFLSRLMSYDYRAPYVFGELFKTTENYYEEDDVKHDAEPSWIDSLQLNKLPARELHVKSVVNSVSCRDGVLATILQSDAFLLQEILGKMIACQLAVPLILPNPLTKKVTMLLWGLRQIQICWAEDSGEVKEVQITEESFPTVAVCRLGDIAVSKSTILNLMLGSVQGKDDHPFFLSGIQDVKHPEFYRGVLEAFWFQPSHGQTKNSLSVATCFLNLRGDANKFVLQRNFACGLASLIVVFVNSTDVLKFKEIINEMSYIKDVLLIELLENRSEATIEHFERITVCKICKKNDKLIAERLCDELRKNLSKENIKVSSLSNQGVKLSNSAGISVDIQSKQCSKAKDVAHKILRNAKASPADYKASTLQLQQSWCQWTKVDKDRSWQSSSGDIEKELNQRKIDKRTHRENQLKLGASKPIQDFYEYLMNAKDEGEMQFLTTWLHILLNEISRTTLSGLVKQIQQLARTSRNIKKSITINYSEIEENKNLSEEEKRVKRLHVKTLEAKEERSKNDRINLATRFDDESVGFEHLLRELGQLYESQCELKINSTANKALPLKDAFTKLAAKLLLAGQPIEILDGDACHVPILWVKGLLKAVQSQIGKDAKLFIISVLGIQSSGKSTLLNSMFGVRFAVSSGRCTRGVYMQLIEVDTTLRETLGCDFVVIIDTEGLRAPEKNIAGTTRFDSEIATFALCLSNVTLINIGGQTVGDDLTDVLQVAAHAFIRMKKVHLHSSCRIVQQFVADLTARAKNENSTQSIKQKLDEAIKTAAKEEGMHRRYRQFTDVFNILNEDDVRDLQYIPSLWRSSTAPPNHSYSEKVLELKSSILHCIKQHNISMLQISHFGRRIEDLWNAVKQEDFVFNFRNSIIMAQYKTFQEFYQRLKIDASKEIMSSELERKDQILSATVQRIDKVLDQAKIDLQGTIAERHNEIKEKLEGALEKCNFTEVKALYKDQFLNDLQFFIQATVTQMEMKLDSAVMKARKKKMTEDTHLSTLKTDLRESVFLVARNLRASQSSHLTEEIDIPEGQISKYFEDVWSAGMKKIQSSCTSQSDTEVRPQVDKMIKKCMQTNVDQTNFSKFLRAEVQSEDSYLSFSAYSENVHDKEDVIKLIQSFENGNTTTIDPVYKQITKIVQRQISKSQTCNADNILSDETLQHLRTQFTGLLQGINLHDKSYIQWRFTCVAGFTLFMLQQKWKSHVLQCRPQFLRDKEILFASNKQDTVHEMVTIELEKKLLTCKKEKGRRNKFRAMLEKKTFFVQNRDGNESEIEQFLESLKYDHTEYESSNLISHVLDSVIEIVYSSIPRNRKKILRQSCFRVAEAICQKLESIKIDWGNIEDSYPEYAEGCKEIKRKVLSVIKDILEESVADIERGLTPQNIQKLANIPHNSTLQKAIDINILSKLENHQTDDYQSILSEVRNIKCRFLRNISERNAIDDVLISELINETQTQFSEHLETDEGAYMILHMCAWALPLCTAVQISYENKNDFVIQLEDRKPKYYEDFKNWCLDSANDTRQAEELHDLLNPAMLISLKNKICTTLYGLIAHEGEIFRSRQHLIKHMLRELAENEDFKTYLLYIKNHSLFTTNWITTYIANLCSKRTSKLNIDDLVSSEIRNVVDVTRQCFVESLPHEKKVFSPVKFLDRFRQKCKDKYSINMDENGFETLKTCSSDIKSFKTYETEFLKLLEKLPSQFLCDLRIPKENDIENTKQWVKKLPEPLDVELGKRVEGCREQCPFCGSVCDVTTEKHSKHIATLHYPIGINGLRDKRTKLLVCDICTSTVATDLYRYYPNCTCDVVKCECEWFYFKDYEKMYPDWHIRPVPDTEPIFYWKWVIAKFNRHFAESHKAREADIPDTWTEITKSEALHSLDEAYR